MARSFFEAKTELDEKYKNTALLSQGLVPVHGRIVQNISIKNQKGENTEEYYKWQFVYALIHSGLYPRDFIEVEVCFPKGNPSSRPIILDGAIFDDSNWLHYYHNFWENRDQSSLEWLRNNLIGVIEFKKEDGRDIEKYINQQLKPALKESDREFVIGFYYDTERILIFQKRAIGS